MYITQEYSVLNNMAGGDNITIMPNTPFSGFSGQFIVTAYVLVRDADTGDVITTFSPGQVLNGFPDKDSLPLVQEATQDLDKLTKRELKDILFTMGRSYSSKATNKQLIELVNA